MSRIAQTLPKIGLVMEDVKIVRWIKHVGERVAAGEAIVEVENEKSTVEIEAAVTGRLAEILIEQNGTASVGDRIAWIESDEAATDTAAPRDLLREAPARDTLVRDIQASAGLTHEIPQREALVRAAQPQVRIASTPVARRLAGERGVDLHGISGSGPGGRVQLRDVERALEVGSHSSPAAPRSTAHFAAVSGGAGSASASCLLESSMDWTSLLAAQRLFARVLPTGVSQLIEDDFLLQGIALALVDFPQLRSTRPGGPRPGTTRGVHLALIGTQAAGLVQVLVRDVDTVGLPEIARRRAEAIAEVCPEAAQLDSDAAAITLCHLGDTGPERLVAAIHPPQIAMLAVGRRRDAAVVRHGMVVARPMSNVSLTVDARAADFHSAAKFLSRVIEILEGNEWRL